MKTRAQESYGEQGVSWVDRVGVWLSQRAIRRHLPARDDLEILELGCGHRAKLLTDLNDRIRRGVGVDFHIDPALLAWERFTFHQGSIEETLPRLASASFDVVMLISVLEHLADPLAALLAARRLLKSGGVLLINVPTWRGKIFLEFSAFRLGWSPPLEMDYDRRDLWPLLVQAGFQPSRIDLRLHKFGLNLFAAAHLAHAA